MNKLSLILAFFVLAVISISCGNKEKTNSKSVFKTELKETDKYLSFELDNSTSLVIKSMFTYLDKKGNEYLAFQNNMQAELLIYDIKKQSLHKKITFDREGPNSVGYISGFHISNFNEIYLNRQDRRELIVCDIDGKQLRTIPYGQTSDGIRTTPGILLSFAYTPLIIDNGNIYITQYPNPIHGMENIIEESAVSAIIDTAKHETHFLPFKYPPIIKSSEYRKKGNLDFSREFDGTNFIYSFTLDENIYITSKDHQKIKKINAKSQYIKHVVANEHPGEINSSLKQFCTEASYGNIVYDKYRKVYYRIAYPETQTDETKYLKDEWEFGRKKFSIIILDKNFNIIGETLFPEYNYISTLMFVHPDGLYISDSHYKNPGFNENKLSFRLFKLSND